MRKQNENNLIPKTKMKQKINKPPHQKKKTKPQSKIKCKGKLWKSKYWCFPCEKQGLYQLYSRNIYRMSAIESAKIWLVSHLKREAQNSGLWYLKVNRHRNFKTTWTQGPVFWLLVITHVDLRGLPWYFAVPSAGFCLT